MDRYGFLQNNQVVMQMLLNHVMRTRVNNRAPYEPLGNTKLQKYLSIYLYNVYGHADPTCAKFFIHAFVVFRKKRDSEPTLYFENLKGPLSFPSVFLTLQKVVSWLISIFITIQLKRMDSAKMFEL